MQFIRTDLLRVVGGPYSRTSADAALHNKYPYLDSLILIQIELLSYKA